MTELEEERRLAYVGMTRAMDRLYMSYAMRRTLYGNTFAHPKSRFLEEMPSVEVIGNDHADAASGGRSLARSRHSRNRGRGRANSSCRSGDRVRHPKWGEGLVSAVDGAGGDGLLTIMFPNVGEKMVMLKYAPLEKVT